MANARLTNTELAPTAPLAPLFYSEEEAALLLGIHRTTLRHLAVDGKAPVPPVHITEHKRVYRRIDVERLAGVVT
jgi:hypothetical protein